jgi:hypothetical protein
MALSNYTYFEVRTTGSDTTNSGGFDINSSGFPTDGSITSANTASPVISSASYTFVAGDVGACVFIKSGTNSIPGWYRIVSVNAGAATLNGSIGQAFIATALQPSTSLGCGITASLSSITFGVDYSQQDTYRYTGSFVVQATTTNIVGSGITINRSWVGNLINLTGVGAGLAISGYYNIASVGGTVATLDRSAGTAGSASTGYVGGAFFSPGQAQSIKVQSNKTYIKSGTYMFNTTTRNVSMGALTNVGGSTNSNSVGFERLEGYGNLRGDKLNPPTFKAGVGFTGTSLFGTLYTNLNIENIVFDGSGNSGVIGIQDLQNPSRGVMVHKCKFTNLAAPTTGLFFGVISFSEFSNNTGQCVYCREGLKVVNCSFYGNTASCVALDDSTVIDSIFANNTGGSTSGITMGDTPGTVSNCTFYKNGYSGILIGVNGGRHNTLVQNCLFVNNVTTGLYVNTNVPTLLNNAFYTTTGSNHTFIGNTSSFVILSGNPLVDPDNGNFNLNSVAGAGLSCRAINAGSFLNYINTTSFNDIGAVQNINSPVTYVNPERSITIKSGTTSRTEYIYLNTTGYTFSSTGLSASYVRAGSARVAIPLVSQTVTGAYASGGFCEIDAANMPGLYRLDVPNAIFNTGVKTAALEIINTTTNDRQLISYQFSQDQTLDFTQLVPTSNSPNTVGDALNAARAQGFGKWVLSGTALTIYAGDNTTMVKTFTIDSVTNPTSRT